MLGCRKFAYMSSSMGRWPISSMGLLFCILGTIASWKTNKVWAFKVWPFIFYSWDSNSYKWDSNSYKWDSITNGIKTITNGILTITNGILTITNGIFTRGQFWAPGIVVACDCLCVCVSACPCVNHLIIPAITQDPFKLGLPNVDQRCKTPWLRSLLFCGVIDLDLQSQI